MNKKNRTLLIAIVAAMAVIGILLIALVSVQSEMEDVKDAQATTEADETEIDADVEDASQESSEENNFNEDGSVDYNADIQEKTQDASKLLVIGDKTFGVPCKFGELKNEFSYMEPVPESVEGGGFSELHALSGDTDTGLSLMLLNTSDHAVSTDDLYVGSIILTEKKSPTEISIGGLKIGSQLGDIEEFLKTGGYKYFVDEIDCEKTFRVAITEDESVSLMIIYDNEKAYVYKMILEYVII